MGPIRIVNKFREGGFGEKNPNSLIVANDAKVFRFTWRKDA
jgi:hypothetical protein